MTVSSQTASIVALGDGVNTAFVYDFEVPYQADGSTPAVAVFTTNSGGVQTVLTLNVDFSISGVGNELGGSVTYPLAGDPLPSGNTITIYRALEYVQDTVLEDQGFRASSAEHMGDTLEMQLQQVVGEVAGSVRGQPGEVLGRLPSAEARALQTILFDADGNPGVTPLTILVATGATSFGTLALAQAATIPAAATFVILMGYYAVGDTVASVYIRASAGAGAGKFQSADGQWWIITGRIFDPRQFGAKGDDSTNDRTAFNNAQGFGPLVVTPGTYRFASSLTFTVAVQCISGAILRPASTFTLAFNAGFEAELTQCFSNATAGLGTITFSPAHFDEGYPEWWGAVSGTSAVNCTPALVACVVACPRTQLQAADYWLTATWKVNTGNRRISGISFDADGVVIATRVLIQSATLDTCQIGPDSDPGGGPNSFLSQVEMDHISFTRDRAPTAPNSGFVGPAGLRIQWTRNCYVDRLWSNESCSGYYIRGNVGLHLTQCYGFRSVAGTYAPNDFFHGFHQDNTLNIGLASGNASVYYTECNVNMGAAASAFTESSALYTDGGFTDTFVDKMESASTQFGANLNSAGGGQFAADDMRVDFCTFDQCWTGVRVTSALADTAVNLQTVYVGLTADSHAVAGFSIQSSAGAITIMNGVVIAGAGSTGKGLVVASSKGIKSVGNIYKDLAQPIALVSCSNSSIEDTCDNATVTLAVPAVSMTTCSRVYMRPIIQGGANAYSIGVSMVSTGNSRCEVNMTTIDSSSVSGGAGNKLVNNAVQITSVGVFNTNCAASGVPN